MDMPLAGQAHGQLLDNVLLNLGLSWIPFAVALFYKFQVDFSSVSVCGALVAQLERHYGISIAEARASASALPLPTRARVGVEPDGGASGRTGERPHASDAAQVQRLRVSRLLLVDRTIQSRCRWFGAFWVLFVLFIWVGAFSEFIFHATAAGFELRGWWTAGGGFAVYMGLHVSLNSIVIVVASAAVMASMLLLCTQTQLLRDNILAYRALHDILCLKVRLLLDGDGALRPQHIGTEAAAARRVADDPLVAELRERIASRERFLHAMAQTLIKGHVHAIINSVYAFIFLCYITFALYVVMTVLRLREGSLDPAHLWKAVVIVPLLFTALFFFMGPLGHMADQAQAWLDLAQTFKWTSRKKVSKALHAGEPGGEERLFIHHRDLSDVFTWKLFGTITMTYGYLLTTLAALVSPVLFGIAIPMMNSALNRQLSRHLPGLNVTLPDDITFSLEDVLGR